MMARRAKRHARASVLSLLHVCLTSLTKLPNLKCSDKTSAHKAKKLLF